MRKLTLSLFAASTVLFSFGQKMLQPKSSIEILIEGFQEMEKENYDQAEAQFKLISVNDTNYVVAQKELAITYMASDRHQEAVDILEDLLIYQSKFKDRANVYTLLGQAYDGLEQYDKSRMASMTINIPSMVISISYAEKIFWSVWKNKLHWHQVCILTNQI